MSRWFSNISSRFVGMDNNSLPADDRKITAYDIYQSISKNENPAYITSIGKQTIEEIKNEYTGPCSFEPSIGKKIYLCEISKDEKVIQVLGYIIVGKTEKVGKNYRIIPMSKSIHTFEKFIQITTNQAELFNLPAYKVTFKEPKNQLKFMRPISYDANQFLEENGG